MNRSIVFVSGASSGIGKAIAETFLNAGYIVYGTSRKAEFNQAPDNNQIVMLPMDVTNEDSVKKAVSYVLSQEGNIDILVNCAGSGIAGSIEAVPVRIAQQQFDVTFFGALRVIQAVMPTFRKNKTGRIINIGSVAGYIPIPFQSMYSASKFAMESLSETLRMEAAKFRVKVSLVEPGDTKTNFTAQRQMAGIKDVESAYMPECKNAIQQMEKDEQNGYSPETVAKIVLKVAKRRNPPVRVSVGFQYQLVYGLSRILPAKLKLIILKMIY